MALLDALVEPFDRADPRAVAELLTDRWGLERPHLSLLETERDDTFRVEHSGGIHLVKVAHPNDGPELLALQDAALALVAKADPDLPVPRLVPADAPVTLDGRIVRVLTWLPGSPAGRDRLQLRIGGELLGRLNRALAPLEHPAADRLLPWDLQHVAGLADYTDDPEILDAIARYTAEIVPALDALPRQIVHGDFHPHNVLADNAGAITGVIDFGDIARTARVCDVGVALGYLVPVDGPMDAVRSTFLDGFESVVPLSDAEREVIPGLVVGRQIQRIVINDELGRLTGERADPTGLFGSFRRAQKEWT